MAKMTLNINGVIFGIFGTIIGAVPVSILKTLLLLEEVLCSFTNMPDSPIFLTPCGLFMPTWRLNNSAVVMYVVFLLLGGAIAGQLGSHLGWKRALRRDEGTSTHGWKGAFWWSFSAGILFDLLFVFILPPLAL